MRSLQKEFLASDDPVTTFFTHLSEALYRPSSESFAVPAPQFESGFRPLLLGYSGAGNIGSDIRVAEMIRQFRVIFSHVNFDPSLTVMGPLEDRAFAGVRKIPLNQYFPEFLQTHASAHNAIIACEGSMFTSTFSDLLSGIFAGGIGFAANRGMPAIGYGASAGVMTPRLSRFVASTCQHGFILSRSEQSKKMLRDLGVDALSGADSAWTFEPEEVSASDLLVEAGWNRRDKVIGLCPINPFWWPVDVDFSKARLALKDTVLRDEQYRSFLFHRNSGKRKARYDTYLAALARNVEAWQQQGHFPVLIGMERLDRRHCVDLNARLRSPVPAFISGDFGMNAVCAILRAASLVVSSRFHATVLSLAGNVPVIGVTMDNRIRELFSEHALNEMVMDCDDPELGWRLLDLSERVLKDASVGVTDDFGQITAVQIKRIGEMGRALIDHLTDCYPDFPAPPLSRNWDAYLPRLSPRLEALLEAHL